MELLACVLFEVIARTARDNDYIPADDKETSQAGVLVIDIYRIFILGGIVDHSQYSLT